MELYTVGDTVRVTSTFSDLAGTNADPTTITFKYRTPAPALTTYSYVYATSTEVVKSTTGIYYVDVALTTSGEFRWRWVGAGALAAADEGPIFVEESSF